MTLFTGQHRGREALRLRHGRLRLADLLGLVHGFSRRERIRPERLDLVLHHDRIWFLPCLVAASSRAPCEAARYGTATRGRGEKQKRFLRQFPHLVVLLVASPNRYPAVGASARATLVYFGERPRRPRIPAPVFEKGVSMANPSRTDLLRALPQVEEMLQLPEVSALLSLLPRSVLADCVREAVDETRRAVLAGISNIG